MSERVQIKVNPDGKITCEALGVEGSKCLDLVKPFEEALGGKSHFDKKPEFTREPHLRQSQDQEAGQ